MKKTISITLGGRVFVVEEDAYDALENYLREIKNRYRSDDTADEIVADIESSIADKFAQKISKDRQAVTLSDVQAVIEVMGKPEEIAGDEPKTHQETEAAGAAPRRLFRDPDNMVVAGVCSGLAAYFGIDPVIVRIIFLALTVGHGVGVVLYIVLWLVIPKANTSSEKLGMRGKNATVNEIKEMVREKSQMISDEGREAFNRLKVGKPWFYRVLNVPVLVIGAIFKALRSFLLGIFPILTGIIGALLFLVAMLSIIGVTVFVGVVLFNTGSPYLHSGIPLVEFAARPFFHLGVVAAYFVTLVPLLFVSLVGVTVARRKNTFHGAPSLALVVLWIAALAVAAGIAANIVPWAVDRAGVLHRTNPIIRSY